VFSNNVITYLWRIALSEQNPVFIPGPTNIPDVFHKACDICLNGSPFFKVAGKVFRIGYLGILTDVMASSGITTAEMALVDLNFPASLGSGV